MGNHPSLATIFVWLPIISACTGFLSLAGARFVPTSSKKVSRLASLPAIMMKPFPIFCPDAAQIISRNSRKVQKVEAIFHILRNPNINFTICRILRIALFFLLNILILSKVMPIDLYRILFLQNETRFIFQ